MCKIYEQFRAYGENILSFHKTAGTDILYMLFWAVGWSDSTDQVVYYTKLHHLCIR